jgi:hypothetical protein
VKSGTPPAVIEALQADREAVKLALDALDSAVHQRGEVRKEILNTEAVRDQLWRTHDPLDHEAGQKLDQYDYKIRRLKRWADSPPPLVADLNTLVSVVLGCEQHVVLAAEKQSIEEGPVWLCAWKSQITLNFFALDLEGKIFAATSAAQQVLTGIDILLKGPVPRLLNTNEITQVRQGTMKWDPALMKLPG